MSAAEGAGMAGMRAGRVAVVLFNLGGPDSPEAIRPFLFNLFDDPAIIGAPGPVRRALAHFISWRRAPKAAEIYGKIGGRSPILPQTEAQAEALAHALAARRGSTEFRCFVAMRYWRPQADEVAAAVRAWAPDRIVLLPLYPQMSTATSESSVRDWNRAAAAAGLAAPTSVVCCWPAQAGFVAASADLVRDGLARAGTGARLLFSAHGLPEKTVARGDPYQWQVERSARAIVERLAIPDLDWAVCYQSRVGPLKWIGPPTEAELRRAASDRKPVVLFPVAFVSEHSETLVELDIEYAELAHAIGLPGYVRVPTVTVHQAFVGGLADLTLGALDRAAPGPANDGTHEACPASFGRCPRVEQAACIASGRAPSSPFSTAN